MKTLKLTALAALILVIGVTESAFAQQTLIVDGNANAPTGAHVFADLDLAIAAASDGDVIQIVPIRISGAIYNAPVVDKSVKIVGNGWAPQRDFGFEPKVSGLIVEAPDVVLEGLDLVFIHMDVDQTFGSPTPNNLTVRNCSISSALRSYSAVTGLHVYNCLLDGEANFYSYGAGPAVAPILENNIIFGLFYVTNQAVVTNNLFIKGSPSSYSVYVATHSLFANNIFYGTPTEPGQDSFSNTYSNNLSYGLGGNLTQLPPVGTGVGNDGTDNLIDVDPGFVSISASSTIVETYDINLQPGSPAIGTGTEGTDIGPMGGNYPFNSYFVGGNPLPLIEELNTSAVVVEGGNLQINVKARVR